jgi:ribonuclease BN (tRNA processing enzyme)
MVGYISDNEFLKGCLGHPDNITADSDLLAPYSKLVEFMSDIDMLIREAQYTNEEYHHKIEWGHSSLSNACHLMRLAGIRKWIVTNHDPMHDDEFLHKKLNLTKQIMRDLDYQIDVYNGFHGMIENL